MTIQEAWDERRKLHAKGDKLYIEYNKLYIEGNEVFINAVIAVHGKEVKIKWEGKHRAVVEGVIYELVNYSEARVSGLVNKPG